MLVLNKDIDKGLVIKSLHKDLEKVLEGDLKGFSRQVILLELHSRDMPVDLVQMLLKIDLGRLLVVELEELLPEVLVGLQEKFQSLVL